MIGWGEGSRVAGSSWGAHGKGPVAAERPVTSDALEPEHACEGNGCGGSSARGSGARGGVSAQTGFRPASELVAFTPPLYVLPMNVGEVIMGLAERYVYQEGTGTQTRVKVTEDFLSVTVLALPAGGASAQLKGVSEDGRRIVGRVGVLCAGVGAGLRLARRGCAGGSGNGQCADAAAAACKPGCDALGVDNRNWYCGSVVSCGRGCELSD